MIRRSEVDWIRRIGKMQGAAPLNLVLGIGDDCAILRPRVNEDLLFTTDMLIEDVHFRRDTHGAADIGHKALARGLSDIAAMGGEPRFCLLSLALADWVDDAWVDKFYRGLLNLARRYETALAGGDLSHSTKLTCDIVVCGAVPRGRSIRRDTARVNDEIYVSGRLGRPWQTHLRPKPQVELGIALRGRATAAMDLSDGLSLDLHRLCEASGVAAELDSVPVVRGSTQEQALHSGEDYHLLFTARPNSALTKGVFRVGKIIKGKPGAMSLNGRPLEPMGYDHFRK